MKLNFTAANKETSNHLNWLNPCQDLRVKEKHLCPPMQIIKCTLNFDARKCPLKFNCKPPICNFMDSFCIHVIAGLGWEMLPFVYLRSLVRKTWWTFSGVLARSYGEIHEKARGLFVLLIEICVHLNDCNPGHFERKNKEPVKNKFKTLPTFRVNSHCYPGVSINMNYVT